jgi:hypothetical protein
LNWGEIINDYFARCEKSTRQKLKTICCSKPKGEKKFMVVKCFLGISTSLFSRYNVFP